MILDPGQQPPFKGNDKWHNLGTEASVGKMENIGPMDLMLIEENSPLVVSYGKKRQRVVEDCLVNLNISYDGGSIIVTTSSVEQSSRSVPNKLEKLGQQLYQTKSKTRKKKKNRVELEERLNRLYCQDTSDEILAEIMDVQARINWLRNGDRNTSFFHKVAAHRHSKGRINKLEVEDRR
ncbi:hypothetical protein J1N35_038575 [Gossypium stocksii]|uniref:Uncharacterized protein n=1 Tax=Gossypium stocksii TaxID=47602 RepID=A0A9D3ZLZ0_9ROSI|nr:hypothetical protein J1N35_038575 [Gossypium stocksii]